VDRGVTVYDAAYAALAELVGEDRDAERSSLRPSGRRRTAA